MEAAKLADRIADILREKKGENIRVFDVREVSSLTEFCVVASGMNRPHIKALVEEAAYRLKKQGIRQYGRSGDPDSGWVALDFVDVVIHIFSREARAYYAIEDLWAAPRSA